jgi:hypothetical protein
VVCRGSEAFQGKFANTNHDSMVLIVNFFSRAYSAHMFAHARRLKNGGKIVLFWFFYGRFFSSSNASKAPTIAIAAIMPAIAGTKYRSATDAGG